MQESTIVALALGIGGLIGALLAMLYRETITKRLDRLEAMLAEVRESFHRIESRIMRAEIKVGLEPPNDY